MRESSFFRKLGTLGLIGVTCLAFLTSCEGFFGKKITTDFLGVPVFEVRPVAYIPIQPTLTGFAKPTDVLAGFDELIYVVDEGTEQVIAYDESYRELGRLRIQGAKAVAQDLRLDLLVLGSVDTTINNVTYRLNAIYRIDLKNGVNYGIRYAKIKKLIVHPFYFTANLSKGPLLEQVVFNRIAVMADNFYYVTRNGPINITTQFGGPDDGVILFDDEDRYRSNIEIFSQEFGNIRDYFKKPFGIKTFVNPPQRVNPSISKDFFVTSLGDGVALRTQLIGYTETEDQAFYSVRILGVGDTTRSTRFLYDPLRFGRPTGLALTGDGTNYLFVLDSEKDSLFQFTNQGAEGVVPPPGSLETRNIIASFGGRGSNLNEFRNPQAIAYSRRIVMVADTDNQRVLLFRLSTDFQ